MRRGLVSSIVVLMGLSVAPESFSGETDQYLVWGVEMKDSLPAFDAFMAEAIDSFLERANGRVKPICDCEALTQEFFTYLFKGLHASRVRRWFNRSDQVERFPDDSVSNLEYQRMSIYRGLSFPFVLPMASTVRLGEVHLGIDKIGHFFGFGRRYYKGYLRFIASGDDRDEATRRVVRAGITQEAGLVGKVVDGIFSHGDLEANFQGFRFARDFCEGEASYFTREGEDWLLRRPIEMGPYITPDLDESYNNNHYWAKRRKHVLPRIDALYGDRLEDADVQERFARYGEILPSFSKRVIDGFFERRGLDPQAEQSLASLRGLN